MLIITTIFFSFTNYYSYSQAYHPFPSSIEKDDTTIVAIWTSDFYYWWLNTAGVCKIAMVGDTVINNKIYSKLYSQSEYSKGQTQYYTCDTCDFQFDLKKATYSAAIREEHKAIYIVNINSITEYKPFNFNIFVGDTLWTDVLLCDGLGIIGAGSYNGAYVTVLSMDSIILTDGTYRKRYQMNDLGDWIEGIGTSRVFNTIFIMSDFTFLFDCYSEINKKVLLDYRYYNGGSWNAVESCSFIDTTSGISENFSITNDLKVYPNPAKETINISLKKNMNIQNLEITNLFGERVYSNTINSNQCTIETTFLNNGIYFIRIGSEAERHSFKILIFK